MPWQESELVEARLERSQAEAKAQRAQQHLDKFLAQQALPQVRFVHYSPVTRLKPVHTKGNCGSSLSNKIVHVCTQRIGCCC